MAFGLIGAGLGIAQSVMGMVGGAKGGGGGGGKAEKGEKAGGGEKAKKKDKEEPMEKFRQDIKKARTPAEVDAIKKQIMETVKKKVKNPKKREKIEKEINDRSEWRMKQLKGIVPSNVHDASEVPGGVVQGKAPAQPAAARTVAAQPAQKITTPQGVLA